MNTITGSTFILLLSLALSACANFGGNARFDRIIPARVIGNSVLCGTNAAASTLDWISSPARLQQQLRSMDSIDPESDVDFNTEDVLFLAMGEQPTTGYRLNLLPQEAVRFNGAVLEINVGWRQPEPDAVEAQVITRPCLLAAIQKVDFQRIRIVDQDGTVRIEQTR